MQAWTTSRIPAALALALGLAASSARADVHHVTHQTLYVPIYSEIAFGAGHKTIRLSATLSVRNLSRRHSITITRVDYFSSSGKLVHQYLEAPLVLSPLAAQEFVVAESDLRGGVSASFLIDWSAESAVVAPMVESIMIGTAGAQGISFVGRARVLEDAD